MSGPQCSGPNQSPINLSQSFTKPCDLLCDLVFDTGSPQQGTVWNRNWGDTGDPKGLMLQSDSLGSCKLNGEGYASSVVYVCHPSRHTIENLQSDAEVFIVFTSATGKYLTVCALIRVNGAQTPSSSFFNKFVPYVANSGGAAVKFSDDWNLSQIVPSPGAFYSYDGSYPDNCAVPSKTIVFNSMINMSGTDFATLKSKTAANTSITKSLGNRDVFFNSAEKLPGGPLPHDNKIYMRLKPAKGVTGPGDGVKPVKAAPLGEGKSKEEAKDGIATSIYNWSVEQLVTNSLVSILDVILMIAALGVAIYFAMYKYHQLEVLMFLNKKASVAGNYVRSLVVGSSAKFSSAVASVSARVRAPSAPLPVK